MSEISEGQYPQPDNLDFAELKNDVWGELEKWDESVRRYHLGIQDAGLDYFRESIRLLGEMILGIAELSPGWHPKFAPTSAVKYVLALSASGSLRSLLAAYKLLIDGYFLEAHAAMRMIEQWVLGSVVVEAQPQLANEVLERGVKESHVEMARKKSGDLDKLLRAMHNTFSELSKRCHFTRTAVQLTAPSISAYEIELTLAGNASSEMLCSDSLALTGIALNVMRVLRRHFRVVPAVWHSRFVVVEKLSQERKNQLSGQAH